MGDWGMCLHQITRISSVEQSNARGTSVVALKRNAKNTSAVLGRSRQANLSMVVVLMAAVTRNAVKTRRGAMITHVLLACWCLWTWTIMDVVTMVAPTKNVASLRSIA